MSSRSDWKILVAGLCLLACACNVHASQLAIVIADEAGEVERFAAEELQRYLKKITGEDVSVGTQSPQGAQALLVGSLSASEKEGLGEEGYVLRSTDRGLILAGSGRRGTPYAVYDFLERLGCRWYYPDPEDEIVPRLAMEAVLSVAGSNLDVTEKPDFSVRMYRFLNYLVGPCGTPGSDAIMKRSVPNIIDWLAKNRMNIFSHGLDDDPADGSDNRMDCSDRLKQQKDLLPEMRKRGLVFGVGGHCSFLFMSDEQLKKHPEWIAKINGKPRVGDFAMFCTRNEEAVRYYLDNLISFIKENPAIEYFALWPKDGSIWCECERCKDTSPSDRCAELANRIYTEIKKSVPHAQVTYFAYGGHSNPPKTLRLIDGLTVTLCTHSRDMAVPFSDDRTSLGHRNRFTKWREMTRQTGGTFVFHGKYAREWGLVGFHPLPLSILQEDCRWFRQNGLDGFELPIGHMGRRTKSFNLYVLAKLMWNADADVKGIIDDYFNRCYGEAANRMRQAYEEVELAQPDLRYWYYSFPIKIAGMPIGGDYTPEMMDYVANATKHLSKAEACVKRQMLMVDNSKAVHDRMRRFRDSVTYTLLGWEGFSDFIEIAQRLSNATTASDLDENAKQLEAARHFLQIAQTKNQYRQGLIGNHPTGSGLFWDLSASDGKPIFLSSDSQLQGYVKLVNEHLTSRPEKVWQIGFFDNSSAEFGSYRNKPSLVRYEVGTNWRDLKKWPDCSDRHMPSAQKHACEIELVFDADAGQYTFTVGQVSRGSADSFEVQVDGQKVGAIATVFSVYKPVAQPKIDFVLKQDGKHALTLGSYKGGRGYSFDALKLEKSRQGGK